MSDVTEQQQPGHDDAPEHRSDTASWAAFEPTRHAHGKNASDAATRDRIKEAAAANGIEKLQWFGPAQCIKLAAKLQDGDLAGCWFADHSDVVAFLAAVPDQCDGILQSGAKLLVAAENPSDGPRDGKIEGDTSTASSITSEVDSTTKAPPARPNIHTPTAIPLTDLAAGLHSAHQSKRRHQVVAAAALSFFAVACVLVFVALAWKYFQ